MKTFSNASPRDVQQAVKLAQDAHKGGKAVSFSSGGSDLLGLVKERIVKPDVIVSLRGLSNSSQIASASSGLTIGGETTLDEISKHAAIKQQYAVLAEAAGSVATPQIRNVGTIAGNVAQRPWCWYYRNGFPCYKAGGNQCFSFAGENEFHAIFGGGPSYIVHPSDTAPALMALGATFRVVGPGGERRIPASDFFVLPRVNAQQENVLGNEDVIVSVQVPALKASTRSTYTKILDREAWTHAIVSAAIVLEMDQQVVRRASVVLGGVAPIPWRLPEVERMLTGQRITEELAAKAGEQAVNGARPLSKNAYKIPLTKNMVKRTLVELSARA
jgi:xanthine dehydrogenase YagS FAD-binding subunit